MKSLNLNGCFSVGEKELEALEKCKALESLTMFGSHALTDKALVHLKPLKNLKNLHISYSGVHAITGAGLVHFKGLDELRVLSLAVLEKLEDRHLGHLKDLAKLEHLDLQACKGLTDAAMTHVRQLDKLQILNISQTQITDAGIAHLKEHKSLKQILVDGSKVTEEGMIELTKSVASLKWQATGSAFLDAVYQPGQEINDAIRLRYKCQVTKNECQPKKQEGVWKIIFMFHALSGDSGAPFRGFQSNLYSWRFEYPHLLRLTGGREGSRRNFQGQTGLFMSVPDDHRDKKVGARTRVPAMFPTMDQEIDGFKDYWKREQIAQLDLTGKQVTIDIARGKTMNDLTGWNVHESSPKDTYRIWTMTASWEGKSYAVDFALPDSGARYIRNHAPTQIATEAFAAHPGFMQAYFWDIEVQRESRKDWIPLQHWKLISTDAVLGGNTWGMKRATFQSRPAIEVSNDGTKTYLKKGEVIELI